MIFGRVPLRLLVHFFPSRRPLVQITEGKPEGGVMKGMGTRAVDLNDDLRELELYDPRTGEPLGERITVGHAVAVLYSIWRAS